MKTIKVNNPKSKFSYIKIQPYQDFCVQFPPTEKIVDFDYSGDFLECDNSLCFRQLFPEIMADWAKHSSVILGDICIVRKSGHSNLIIVLEQMSPKIKDVLTIIDPNFSFDSLVLLPNQIIELILTDPKHYPCMKKFDHAFGSIAYRECANACVDISDDGITCDATEVEEGFYTVEIEDAEIPVIPKMPESARHFWYKPFISGFTNWPAGTYDAGKLCIGKQYINLKLKLRRKDTSKNRSQLKEVFNPSKKNVIIEEVDGEFDDCDSLEFVGQNKVLRTNDQIIVYKPHEWTTKCKLA